MDHRLFVTRHITGQPIRVRAERFANTGNVAVSEDREGAAEELSLDSVDARVLLQQEFHQRLTYRKASFLGHDDLLNQPEGLRPSTSPARFRLRAKRFGETSPEPWRRRAPPGGPGPRPPPLARLPAVPPAQDWSTGPSPCKHPGPDCGLCSREAPSRALAEPVRTDLMKCIRNSQPYGLGGAIRFWSRFGDASAAERKAMLKDSLFWRLYQAGHIGPQYFCFKCMSVCPVGREATA